MSDENQEEAKQLARKAAREAKAAARDASRAAKVVVEPVIDAAAEEAQDTAHKFEDTARRVNPWVLSRISSDTGQGFIALSVALWAGTIAVNKFRGAYAGRTAVMTRPND